MSKRLRVLTSAFFVATALLLAGRTAHASEGIAELTSTRGEKARCFLASVLLKDLNYRVVISCRDLIIPPAADVFEYTLWVTSADNGRPVKLGDLAGGKGEFKTRTAFTEAFISLEQSFRSRTPSETVLRGSMGPIASLEGPVVPTPTPEPQAEGAEEAESFGELMEEPSPTPTPTSSQGIFGGLRRAGLIAIVVIFIIILVIAAITRSRS